MRADHGTTRARSESSATEECSPEVRYGYDPGCSRPPGGGAGEDAVFEVANALGLTLEEIEEPGGCGREARAMNAIPAYARVGRLLAVAARQLAAREDASVPPSVVTPCSACFRNLSRARNSLATHADLRDRVAEELAVTGLSLDPGSVRVRHLLDVLYEDAGPDEIRRRVTNPLTHLRVAPYYGCLVTRSGIPEPGLENPDPPGRLEEILSALGARGRRLPPRGPLLRRPRRGSERGGRHLAPPPDPAERRRSRGRRDRRRLPPLPAQSRGRPGAGQPEIPDPLRDPRPLFHGPRGRGPWGQVLIFYSGADRTIASEG